jgi:acetylornithine deacetylase/succinyl-diaminopimelate desuccinylase-like protein
VKVTATFQRLHNNAFERPVDSAGMQTALAALRAAGLDRGEPVRGWEVSCDARLFADLRPEADVVSFGPGNLRCAHSDEESITVQEILQGAEALAYMALLYGR